MDIALDKLYIIKRKININRKKFSPEYNIFINTLSILNEIKHIIIKINKNCRIIINKLNFRVV